VSIPRSAAAFPMPALPAAAPARAGDDRLVTLIRDQGASGCEAWVNLTAVLVSEFPEGQ
jgi:hypothetical protein